MAKIMMHVGTLLAKQIDALTRQKISSPTKLPLEKMITEGNCHIGRLLHYFPFDIK